MELLNTSDLYSAQIADPCCGGMPDLDELLTVANISQGMDPLQAALEAHGLWDLSTFLPKKPDEAAVKVIKEMFEASVDGQAYDVERWGQYFRPAGVAAPGGTDLTPLATKHMVDGHGDVHEIKADPKPAASSFDEDEPEAAAEPVAAPAAGSNKNAQDILAMIRARQNKQ